MKQLKVLSKSSINYIILRSGKNFEFFNDAKKATGIFTVYMYMFVVVFQIVSLTFYLMKQPRL